MRIFKARARRDGGHWTVWFYSADSPNHTFACLGYIVMDEWDWKEWRAAMERAGIPIESIREGSQRMNKRNELHEITAECGATKNIFGRRMKLYGDDHLLCVQADKGFCLATEEDVAKSIIDGHPDVTADSDICVHHLRGAGSAEAEEA